MKGELDSAILVLIRVPPARACALENDCSKNSDIYIRRGENVLFIPVLNGRAIMFSPTLYCLWYKLFNASRGGSMEDIVSAVC